MTHRLSQGNRAPVSRFKKSLCTIFFWLPLMISAQGLQPGFDKNEYREMMLISTRTTAMESYYNKYPEPANFHRIYQSQPIGLDNLWDFWVSEDKQTAVISIRGTTAKAESWLANFYAAMVPAKGELRINNTKTFRYTLAENPKAAVHVGWLLSTAYLSEEIIPHIREQYKKGTKNFVIVGHSQGGAIAYLLTAYLYNLQKEAELAEDIRLKTYCSAAPKPGNLYFAYEYEALTQGGWGYNVVNAADWVPETPISIQTLDDFNEENPFKHANSLIQKQKFPARIVLKHIYKQLDKPTRLAQRRYERYLGKMASKLIRQNIQDYESPAYYKSNHYVRTGNTIVLLPDDAYYQTHPDTPGNLFPHHLHEAYLELLKKFPEQYIRHEIDNLQYKKPGPELPEGKSE